MFKKILIATDGSKHSEHAAKFGVDLAQLSNGSVTICYVADVGGYLPPGSIPFGDVGYYAIDPAVFNSLRDMAMEAGEKAAARIEELATAAGVLSESKVLEGDPASEILRLAREQSMDIIVIGSIGKTGLEKFLMGSVAEKVVRNSPVPVLVVHKDPSSA
ncbi:MAG: Universal stress protein [Methanosaeta sp. PtaB.Bin018]|jgi:nucleotide-binding universal stress UspA family protein|nr:universal stress protein [Methanothrix sp.]OPX74873.1 MAG: Universal stress protein [Methanosaeta sp. PtaB.Bin018]OPY46066.1 MAG: Universal stress protein [Methanosaeta sp. PtaU1.Bin016]